MGRLVQKRAGYERTPRSDCDMPPDADVIALMSEYHSVAAVARALGRNRGSVKSYLKRRPQLHAALRALRLTPEQRDENNARAKRAYQQRLQRENPEHKRAVNRRWAANQAPENRAVWNHYNRIRRLSSGVAHISDETRDYMGSLLGDPCSYCGSRQTGIDHIDPIVNGGGAEWDNLTACCRSCNASKGKRGILLFLAERR